MTKVKKIICCIMTLAVIMASGIMLMGCSSKEAENPLEGSWRLSEMEVGEKSYSLEDFAAAVNAEAGIEIAVLIDIDAEGGFVIHVGNVEEPVAAGQYAAAETNDGEDEGTGGYVFAVNDGQHVNAVIEGEKLVFHDTVSAVESKMIFTKENRGE